MWIREELDAPAFAQKFQQWALNSEYLMPIIPLIQPRVEKFSDVVPLAGFFMSGNLDLNEASFEHKSLEKEQIRRVLQFALWQLESERHWDKDHLYTGLSGLSKAMDLKIRDFLFPLFVAISGTASSVSVFESMALLGPDMSRARVRFALNLVGAASKKEGKRWEKEFKALQQAMNS